MSVHECVPSYKFDAMMKYASCLLTDDTTTPKPVIAVWGMMNAGKSYLLNMLTEHYNSEYFATKDVRETAELKQFETDKFIFLDTPGLDANRADDTVALNGAAKADLVLFVHQPQGELEQIEVDFLQQLKASFGPHAEQNIVLVISKADVENPSKINEIGSKVQQQCQELLQFNPRCFQISGMRFHKGIQQQKEGLVLASHLDELKQHINSLSIDASSVRKSRQQQKLKQTLDDLKQLEAKLVKEQTQLQQALKKDFQPFNQAMAQFQQSMQQHVSAYKKL